MNRYFDLNLKHKEIIMKLLGWGYGLIVVLPNVHEAWF